LNGIIIALKRIQALLVILDVYEENIIFALFYQAQIKRFVWFSSNHLSA
jgi:hypothetical protein